MITEKDLWHWHQILGRSYIGHKDREREILPIEQQRGLGSDLREALRDATGVTRSRDDFLDACLAVFRDIRARAPADSDRRTVEALTEPRALVYAANIQAAVEIVLGKQLPNNLGQLYQVRVDGGYMHFLERFRASLRYDVAPVP